jgi:hypothetical protein
MVPLTRHGTDVSSVFSLLGTNENDLTSALGFALSRCSPLAEAVVARIAGAVGATSDGKMSLDLEVRDEIGRTDLELHVGESLYIIEAKRGWLLPTKTQLAQYARRIANRSAGGALVTLSQASHALAKQSLPIAVGGVPVIHLPWRDVVADAEAARAKCRGHERLWLEEFRTYMEEVIWMRRVEDSWVYCVVLNDERPGGKASFKEIVTEQLSYFHPHGVSGWPIEPPNFLAFRWAGSVQRIHRVVDYDVIPKLSERWPYLTDQATNRPHAVYKLGPRIPPYEPIPNDAPYRAARLWVLLDQLQTAGSLAEAIAMSKKLSNRDLGSSAVGSNGF